MGRSRKPFTSLDVPGFESLSLRNVFMFIIFKLCRNVKNSGSTIPFYLCNETLSLRITDMNKLNLFSFKKSVYYFLYFIIIFYLDGTYHSTSFIIESKYERYMQALFNFRWKIIFGVIRHTTIVNKDGPNSL